MARDGSDRKPHDGRALAASALLAALVAATPARAGDGLWDAVLEKLDVKASPASPPPDFVERTRPEPADLGYLPTAMPHKVSPVPVKTAKQVQAEKDALDAARKRQLDPGAPRQLRAAPDRKAGRDRTAPVVPD